MAGPGGPETVCPAYEARTVLCASLAGAAAREGEALQRWHEAVACVVERYGGRIAHAVDDRVVARFGWPRTGDDDAERALRAALDLAAATTDATGHRLDGALRIGVHSVASSAGESGETWVGVAERLALAAAPGTVLASTDALRRAAGLFAVAASDASTAAARGARRVLHEIGLRTGPVGALATSSFVGRSRELRVLRERWASAQAGDGQAVLITGEAGIGKSRLVYELRQELAAADQAHAWLECGASPLFSTTPLYPISEAVRRFATWTGHESAEERLGRLERAVAIAGLAREEAVPLLAVLAGLTLPAQRYAPHFVAPEVERRRLFGVLIDFLAGLWRHQPVVLVVENLQWADPSTIELQRLLVDAVAGQPILVLHTARPEFRAPWPAHPHFTRLTVPRLARGDARRLAREAAAGRDVAADFVDGLVERSGGVPLLVEELARGALPGAAADTLPATLADSLMARLARLGAAREVAQVASVLGRQFPFALLRACSTLPDPVLEQSLGRLVDAALLYAADTPEDRVYRFRHALVRDAAYESLDLATRTSLHAAAAAAIQAHRPGLAATRPELLARHWSAAGDPAAGAAAWQQAGELAAARSAVGEAVQHFERALEALRQTEDTPARRQQELWLELRLGAALVEGHGFAAPESVEAYARARQLGELADPEQLMFVLVGTWAAANARAELRAAQALAAELVAVARRVGTPAAWVSAHTAEGTTRYLRGDLAGAHDHLQRALAHYDAADWESAPSNPGVVAASFDGLAALRLGLVDESAAATSRALAEALRPYDRAWATGVAALQHAMAGEPEAALVHADASLALAAEHEFPIWRGIGLVVRGWALALGGHAGDGIDAAREGVSFLGSLGQRAFLPFCLCLLGEAHAAAGAPRDALACAEDGLVAAPEETVHRPLLLLRRADWLAATGGGPEAIAASVREALALAREHADRPATERAAALAR